MFKVNLLFIEVGKLITNVFRTTECNLVYSLEQEKPYVWLQAESAASVLCMISIHSPDYVFIVLFSLVPKHKRGKENGLVFTVSHKLKYP